MEIYLQKVISRKNFAKFFFLAGILKFNDENSRIWIQDPDPDPSQNVMDPQHWCEVSATTYEGVADPDPHYF